MCHEDMKNTVGNNEDIVMIRYFYYVTSIRVKKFILRSYALWIRIPTKHQDLTSSQWRGIDLNCLSMMTSQRFQSLIHTSFSDLNQNNYKEFDVLIEW